MPRKFVFVLMSGWPARIHDFGVYSSRFCNVEELGCLPHIFLLISSFSMPRKFVFVLLSEWTARIHDFGVYSSCSCSWNAQNRCWIRISHPGIDFPILPIRFLLQNIFFLKPRTCILLWVHPMFWSELVWSGRGENQLDKPSVERNHKKRSREAGYSFLHILKSTERGRHSLRDCVAEKGMLPCVGCVGVRKSKPDLV